MRTPLTYYGGKQRIAPQILELMPTGPVYIEAFAGGLAVLFARPRAQREVLNDLDGRVVAFWRAVRDHPLELADAVASTPYSRAEWEFCEANPVGPTVVETARRLLVTVDHSYARSARSWSSPALLTDRRGRWQPGTWENMPPRVAAATARLQGVALENVDAATLIGRSDEPGVVIYADPPYPKSTRSSGGAGYLHDDDGSLWPRLVEVLLSIERAQVVLSSYPGPELEQLEVAGWRRVDLIASCASSVTRASRGMAPEAVWLSPNIDAALGRLFDFTTTEATA
jgi:DNA adenine methylase